MMKIEEALEVLGLTQLPDEKELKRVYRQFVKIYHPDVKGHDSADKMALVNEAYLVLISRISEKKAQVSQKPFSISAKSLANLVSALDKYAVCPSMFRLIYDLKGALSTYYKALQIGKPELIKDHEPMIKRAYLYLRIFQKVEPTIEVLPEDIRHSFMYKLGEFLAGGHWKNLSKEVNILLEAYFRAYSLIVSLEGAEKVGMPTLPAPEGSRSEESPLGVFSAMSIAGKLRSFASRLRLLLEPRVFKMPDELLQEVESIGKMITDLTSLVYMATTLGKMLSKYPYFGPWMNEVKAYISKIVAGAVAIGDKEVDINSLKMLYSSAYSVLESMSEVRKMAREVASLFWKVGAPSELVEYAEKVSRGEIFSGKRWDEIPILIRDLERYLSTVLDMKAEIVEAFKLLKNIESKISCLMCEDIQDAYRVLSERVFERLSPDISRVDSFVYVVPLLRAIDQFLDVMSIEDCGSLVGVMRGMYSEEMLLRKMGRE